MKTFSKFLMGFAASLAVVGCSSDEPASNQPTVTPDAEGKMYLNVKINDANALSRATDGGYEDGKDYEHAIVRADFFFFDKGGRFVYSTNLTDFDNNKGETPDENIEYKTENIVVLQGLTENQLPTYMVTVLNGGGINPGANITSLVENVMVESLRNPNGNFIMSTTSFFGKPQSDPDRHDDTYYFATKLAPTDFYSKSQDAEKAVPVNVYVERVAAKFSLDFNEKLEYYPVTTTLHTNGNVGGAPEAGTTLYVKFEGWGITGEEKQSHLSKVLDDGWKTNGIDNYWKTWNNTDYHRSFWGKSVSYGSKDPDLTSVTWEEAINNVSEPIYAHETTNTAANIRTEEGNLLIRTHVTSVLLTATVCEEVDGEKKPLDLILYNGVYYRYEDFYNYVLNIVSSTDGLNYYVCDNPTAEETARTYTQVSAANLTFKKQNGKTGRVLVVFNGPSTTTLYEHSVVEGKDVYTPIKDGVTNLNNLIHDNITSSREAIAYTDGKMFYTIPVEHLARTSSGTNVVNGEGDYGVVRNHWYKVTVGKVMNMGNGIFIPKKGDVDPVDPDEPDEPEPLIPEDPTENKWALRAVINVLSWKIVSQNVDI